MMNIRSPRASLVTQRSMSFVAALSLLAVLAWPESAAAQGKYVNYEVQPVHPVQVHTFSVGGAERDVVMVCNTANHSLEFYDTSPALTLIDTIPTGQSPVTVRWDAMSGAAYTCNQIGDSVTKVAVAALPSSGGGVDLEINLVGTYRVGDEPCDLVFLDAGQGTGASEAAILVSLRSRSALAEVDPVTMQVRSGKERIVLSVDPPAGSVPVRYPVGVKNPGPMLATDEHLYVLDRQSDNSDALDEVSKSLTLQVGSTADINPVKYDDLDIFVAGASDALRFPNPLEDPSAARYRVGNLGTTHHAMTSADQGRYVLVVGLAARVSDSDTEDGLSMLPTGFAQSWLWVLYSSSASGGVPVRRPEVDGVRYPSLNLNRDYSAAGLAEVDPSKALSHPTDVDVLEGSEGGIDKVVITAFSSDRVAVLKSAVVSGAPGQPNGFGWEIEVLDLSPVTSPGGAYSMVGPRGVSIDPDSQRAYVMCSLDNSLRCVDISGATPTLVQSIPLSGDDTPDFVRAGREFIYGAKHSRTGMVSCASCHIDGHTDGLAWTLEPGGSDSVPSSFDDAGLNEDTGERRFADEPFPHFKGKMVTQSLRGLVNYTIEGEGQVLATNAPYHWRGDKAVLQDFGSAFENLLGTTLVTQTDLNAMTRFLNGIPHPPNPEQPLDRRLTGQMGPTTSPTRAYDPTEGSGSMRGLKVYHAHNTGGLSCNHCHTTPEGSGNRATLARASGTPREENPMESAALRNIFDFESLVMVDPSQGPADPANDDSAFVRVKTNGLFHDGDPTAALGATINHFLQLNALVTPGGGFGGAARMPGSPTYGALGVGGGVTGWNQNDRGESAVALTEFVRSLDSGTAPAIGWSYNLTDNFPLDLDRWNTIRDQVSEANAGLVLHTRMGGVERSYWFDITSGAGVFRHDSAGGSTSAPVNQFLGAVTWPDVAVLEAVPVGSARRIADRDDLGLIDTGAAPSSLTLEPMAMATQWEQAGGLVAFWEEGMERTFYLPGSGSGNSVKPRFSHQAQIFMQEQVMNAATGPSPVPGAPFGVTEKKHEPPRRFRVSGDNIRHGAVLTIYLLDEVNPERHGYRANLPLFPTGHTVPSTGERYWETAVEIDGEMTLALLNGGPDRVGVRELLDLEKFSPFAPTQTDPSQNNYFWAIVNEDGTGSGWKQSPITIQNTRW